MVTYRSLVAVALLVLLASPRVRGDRAIIDELAWLPADTHTVIYAPPREAPMVKVMLGNFKSQSMEPPACVEAILGKLGRVLQVWRQPGDVSATVAMGQGLSRATVEKCVVELFGVIGLRLTVSQEGAISRITGPSGASSFVGVTERLVVWHDDRRRVEELLAAKGRSAHPQLDALLGRLDPKGPYFSFASIDDYAGKLLGIPSLGMSGRAQGAGPTTQFVATIVFKSEADARRAAATVAQRAGDEKQPPAMRTVYGSVHPTVRGATLEVDLAALFRPDVMKALESVIRAPAAP